MASFPYSHIVCECKKVSLGEIIHAIKEQNATTIKDLQDKTDGFNSFIPLVYQMENNFLKVKNPITANNILKTEIKSDNVAELVCAMAGKPFAKTTGSQVAIDGGSDRII